MLRLLVRVVVLLVTKIMFRLLQANSIPNFTFYLDKMKRSKYLDKIMILPDKHMVKERETWGEKIIV
jgi:hypothetical protein